MAETSSEPTSQGPGFMTKRTSPGYVGNYIYEPRTGSWNHHKKQKATKMPKQHPNRNHQIVAPLDIPREEETTQGQSSESGYDTNTDPLTPRRIKCNDNATSSSSSSSDSLQSTGKDNMENTENIKATSSSEPMQAAGGENSPLHKVLRDLSRCDVSLQRHKNAFQQNCSDSEMIIKEIFSTLYKHLQTREHDLLQELVAIKQTAGSILERRKATLDCLQAVATNCSKLQEEEVEEIRTQIKQFVTDRKVDEEIGTVRRFEGDLDDILPHIMGFGKVKNVRHLYTEWEEFPTELIVRNKNKVTFLSSRKSDEKSSQNTDKNDSPSSSVPAAAPNTDHITKPSEHKPNTKGKKTSGKNSRDKMSLPIGPSSSSRSNSTSQAHSTSHSQSATNSHSKSRSHSTSKSHSTSRSHSASQYPRFNKNHRRAMEERDVREVEREKYSPEELKAIQDRVKSSLECQGVFLYDPITGAGPPVVVPTISSSSTEKQSEEGTTGNVNEENDGKRIVEEDIESESRKKRSMRGDIAYRKKKTPTQLRRERKKRQRERERRHREHEKVGSEESDSQAVTPPPQSEKDEVSRPCSRNCATPLPSATKTERSPLPSSSSCNTSPPRLEKKGVLSLPDSQRHDVQPEKKKSLSLPSSPSVKLQPLLLEMKETTSLPNSPVKTSAEKENSPLSNCNTPASLAVLAARLL